MTSDGSGLLTSAAPGQKRSLPRGTSSHRAASCWWGARKSQRLCRLISGVTTSVSAEFSVCVASLRFRKEASGQGAIMRVALGVSYGDRQAKTRRAFRKSGQWIGCEQQYPATDVDRWNDPHRHRGRCGDDVRLTAMSFLEPRAPSSVAAPLSKWRCERPFPLPVDDDHLQVLVTASRAAQPAIAFVGRGAPSLRPKGAEIAVAYEASTILIIANREDSDLRSCAAACCR